MTAEKDMIKQLKTSAIYEIVEMIRNVSARNAKIEILHNAIEHRRGFKEFLVAVYDPFVQYHIRKIPEYTPENTINTDIEHVLARPKKFLGMLSSRTRTGNEAAKFLTYILESVPQVDAKAIELIIERDIKAGVSASSINKACPDLISVYPCMLASAFKQSLLDDMDFPVFVQTKMDGLRANVLVNEKGRTEVRGRSGKPLGLDGYFDDSVVKQKYEYVLDGEIVVYDRDEERYLSRKRANGIVRKYAQDKISDSDRERYMPVMIVWDYIPNELFQNYAKYETHPLQAPYRLRLGAIPARLVKGSDKIRRIDTDEVENIEGVEKIFLENLSNGDEGVVVKAPASLWRNGRPKDHIKMKDVKECELFITNVVEGKGRLRGKLGAFEAESSDGLLQVSVGSGVTAKQRDIYFDEGLVGMVISVKFNEVIDSKSKKTKCLFLPIFNELRTDKDEANSLEEIENM